MLGSSQSTYIVQLPLPGPFEATYAAYEGGRLARIAVPNMQEYNSTSTVSRPGKTYDFALSGSVCQAGGMWTVERLAAPGSDVKEEVTFNGYAYEYSTLGKAARVQGVASSETVRTGPNGVVSVVVSDSGAVVMSLT